MQPPVSRIAVLLSVIAPEMAQMEVEVQTLSTRCEEMERRNDMLSEDLDQERRDNSDLRTRLRTAEEKVRAAGNIEWVRQDLTSAQNEVARLRAELMSFKQDPRIMEPRLLAYISGEGRELMAAGKKIECIKGVRHVTSWGLKETKDFVEAFKWGCLPLDLTGDNADKVRALVKEHAPPSTIGELIKAKLSPAPNAT